MDNEKTIQDLIKDTNLILAQLYGVRKTFADACVNWADLSCTQAARGETQFGQEFWAVSIEEASPDNFDFQLEIQTRLEGMGYDLVQVTTEW